MAKSTTYKVYDALMEYAQLFERNMDKGDDKTDAGRTVASKGGQTKVTMVITEKVKDQMIADGIPDKSMGYDMFKGPNEAGLYSYNAKRPWLSPFDEYTGVVTESQKNTLISKSVSDKCFNDEGDGTITYTGGSVERICDVKLTATGNKAKFDEPNVVDYNATVEAGEQVHWDSAVNIGNNSDGKVKLSIYKNGAKRIVRLESVGVTNLVEYVSSGEVRF